MAELKTKPTDASVDEFLASIEDNDRRADCQAVMKLMRRITEKKAKMWGSSLVGFGTYRYRYASGREGDWPLTGFSPRKRELTIYIMTGFQRHRALMKKLGKHKTGKSCLYVRSLDDIDTDVLAELVRRSVDELKKRYG